MDAAPSDDRPSAPQSPPDRLLVERAAAGDPHAFARLTGPHRARLVQFADRRLGCHAHLAEDVVQEALLNAYRGLRAGQRPENLRAWLLTIVHNCAMNTHRAHRPTELLQDDRTDATTETATVVEQREWLNWLMGAIVELPERQRDALVGHTIEGRSYQELADRHETTVSAIKTLIHRARRGLAASRGAPSVGFPIPPVLRRLASIGGRSALLGKTKMAMGIVGPSFGAATLASGVLIALPASGPGSAAATPTQPIDHSARPRSPHHHGRGPASVSTHTAAERAPDPRATGRAAIASCLSSRSLTGPYSTAGLRYAVGHLPPEVREYTTCDQQLKRALLHATGQPASAPTTA